MSQFESKKNLTRFTYDNSAFQGWRLYVTRKGQSFLKYFSDKQYGGPKQSLAAAESALNELKEVLAKAKLVDGKHTESTVKKASKILK